MKAYKIIRDGKSLFHKTLNTAAVTYEQDKWSFPSIANSGLFVFDNLPDAVTSYRRFYEVELWECEVSNLDIIYPWTPILTTDAVEKWGKVYWLEPVAFRDELLNHEYRVHPPSGTYLVYPPIGTRITKTIKLTKRLYN
jgi:hypothetical protein